VRGVLISAEKFALITAPGPGFKKLKRRRIDIAET
jgi:hypothetical protein